MNERAGGGQHPGSATGGASGLRKDGDRIRAGGAGAVESIESIDRETGPPACGVNGENRQWPSVRECRIGAEFGTRRWRRECVTLRRALKRG